MSTCEEIDELHRDCMARLNRMAWAVADVLTALELAGEQTHAAINVCRGGAGNAGSTTGDTGKAATARMVPLPKRAEPGELAHG